MATIAATRIESPSSRLIAPWWHTALLVALFLGLAVGGAFFQRAARSEPGMLQQHQQVVPLYLSLMAMEWGLFVWVWRGGLRKTGTKLRELIGGKWASAKDVLVDCGLALGLWSAWTLAELAWNRGFGVGHAASIQTFLPQRGSEILLLLSETIRSFYTQSLDCVVPAGCPVRDRARLPGNRSVREDRVLWRSVWLTRSLAREPTSRHDGACRGGRSQRNLRNLTAF